MIGNAETALESMEVNIIDDQSLIWHLGASLSPSNLKLETKLLIIVIKQTVLNV